MHANVHVGLSKDTKVQRHLFSDEAGESISFMRKAKVRK